MRARNAVLLLAGLALAAMAGVARADDPAAACGPLTCLSAHGAVEAGCGATGRDPEACSATATVDLVMDSPLQVESMDWSVDLSCTATCTEALHSDGTCGWAPVEVRPIGETGCTASFTTPITFRADLSGGCQTFEVRLRLDARARLDPVPSVSHISTDTVTACPEA